jgi:hypothetical protein
MGTLESLRASARKLVKQGRYPYLGRRRVLNALGPDLAAEVAWPATETPIPNSDIAALFANTPNVHKWSHYLPIYESTFGPYRGRPIRMLEIGVARGGSLQMWRQYFHPETVVVGIDIEPTCKQFDDPAHNTHVRIGGQEDIPFLQTVVNEFGPFDIILDDGSHLASHMVETFRYLFPNGLADGGVYLIEDIHANYWFNFRDTPITFADFVKLLIDAMHAHYLQAGRPLERAFRTGDRKRIAQFRVPLATTLLSKIEFYDSVAVVHRGPRELPHTVYR